MGNPGLTQNSLDSLANIDIVSNETFARNGYPHEDWTLLRKEAPVFYYQRNVKDPFWAITKHEDIVKISPQSNENLNGPRLAVFPEFSPPAEDEREIRHLLVMDAPDHPIYRKLTSAHFTPRSVRQLEASIELRVLFRQLAERLIEVELLEPVERLRSSFLGGVKHMQIRTQLTAS